MNLKIKPTSFQISEENPPVPVLSEHKIKANVVISDIFCS